MTLSWTPEKHPHSALARVGGISKPGDQTDRPIAGVLDSETRNKLLRRPMKVLWRLALLVAMSALFHRHTIFFV